MLALVTFFTVLVLSLLFTRIAAEALTHTGLSREESKFQARSAFSGCGYTTSEAEDIVRHPVRRRIVFMLMLLGNVGIITAVSSLIVSFVNVDSSGDAYTQLGLLVAALLFMWLLGRSQWVDNKLSKIIQWALKRYSDLPVHDYAGLLNLEGEFHIAELRVDEDDWIVDKRLQESQLREEGVIILGIRRADKTFVGAPNGETFVRAGDELILYGRKSSVGQLNLREHGRAGDLQHKEAVSEQERLLADQSVHDTGMFPAITQTMIQRMK